MNFLPQLLQLRGLVMGLSLFFYVAQAFSQGLSSPITVDIQDASLEKALQMISEAAQLTFSYNAQALPLSQKVSLQASALPLQNVLGQVLGTGRYQYQAIGNHLIIRKAPTKPTVLPKKPKPKPPIKLERWVIRGQLIDQETGQAIANARIWEETQLVGAFSERNGEFVLGVLKSQTPLRVNFYHTGYKTQTLYWTPRSGKELLVSLLPIYLEPIPLTHVALAQENASHNPLLEVGLVNLVISDKLLATPTPTNQLLQAPFQLSLLSPAGSHAFRSGKYVNRISVNLLAGYAGGVSMLEVGGLLNIDRYDVSIFQLAGMGNIVGGKTRGFQGAGLFNLNLKEVNGIQLSGFHNYARQVYGIQASGVNNLSRHNLTGIQATGLLNLVIGQAHGAQVAGMGNIGTQSLSGFQASGIFNYAKIVSGAQLSGLFNLNTKHIRGGQVGGIMNSSNILQGLQIAGLFNLSTQYLSGIQAAGILNVAKHVKGVQIGLINIADSLSGASIGLLSLIRNGYHSIEASSSEVFPLQTKLKLGTERFYTIYGSAPRTGDAEPWGVGFGFGTLFPLGKKWDLQLELSTWQVNEVPDWDNNTVNLLNNASLTVRFSPTPWLSLTAGPVFRYQYSHYFDQESGEFLSRIAPYTLFSERALNRETQHLGWIGAEAGLGISF